MNAPTFPVSAGTVLEARGIVLSIGGNHVLQAIDLAVTAHEFMAILALGGAGKTQLFRLLAGLHSPTKGQVFWFGHELASLSERQIHSLRRFVGAVHQEGVLFADLTVEENLMLPLVELTDHDQQLINATVEFTLVAAGLTEHRHQYPVALPAVTIRKAALARALVMGPRLLLCDDVFSGLDPQAKNQINDYLRALHMLRDMTTVILTHNVHLAMQLADRVAILANGRIVAIGTPAEIQRYELPEVLHLLRDNDTPTEQRPYATAQNGS